MSNLKILSLYEGQLTSLPKGLFSGLDSLTSLHLQSSQLTSLPPGVFSGLDSLTSLHLGNNKLKNLPSRVFVGLDSLTHLYLQDSQLTSLPKGVFSGLDSLTSLHLQSSQLTSLPPGVFSGLDSLTHLYLQDSQLTSLPKGVFSGLGSLTYLNLENNKLKSLPSGVFGGLGSLRYLDMENNKLTNLPSGVFVGLSGLRSLRLENNALTNLPKDGFSDLDSLTHLYLDNNKLKNLPSRVFGGLDSLTYLNLENNALTNLPKDGFSDLHSLTHLHLDNNPGADGGWIWIDGESREEVIPDPNPPPTDVPDGTKNLYKRIKEIVLYKIWGKEYAPDATPLVTEGMPNGNLPVTVDGDDEGEKVVDSEDGVSLLDSDGSSDGNLPVTVGGDDEGGEGADNGSGVSLVDNDGASDDLIELLEKIKPARPDDKKWLFVIGAEDYKNTDSIVYSRRSAERFVEVASKVFGIKLNRRVVLLEGATGGAIEDQLKAMLRKVRKGESIYFYYSGHGIPIRNAATRENTPYMLAIDHEPSLIEEKEFYNLNNIYDILNESQASKVLVILDSCFSGSTDGKSVLKGVGATMLIPDLPLLNREGKMAVITAGTDNEYSNALPAKQHRLFSYYLMRALLTGKYRNIGDLHATVYDAVVEESRNLGGTNRQTPQLQGNPNLTF